MRNCCPLQRLNRPRAERRACLFVLFSGLLPSHIELCRKYNSRPVRYVEISGRHSSRQSVYSPGFEVGFRDFNYDITRRKLGRVNGLNGFELDLYLNVVASSG